MRHLFRKIRRSPINFLLGQFSLVLGITSCLIIYTFVSFHESFDSLGEDSDQISRVIRTESNARTIAKTEGTLKGDLQVNYEDIPVTHFMETPVGITFEFKDKLITEESGLLVDQEFFSVFSGTYISGNVNNYLSQPNSLVLTKSVAQKIFNHPTKGLNETVHTQMGPDKIALTVTGIIEDNPTNSSLEFSYLMTGSGTVFWNDESPYTVFNTFIKTNEVTANKSVIEYLNSNKEHGIRYELQGLTDIHLSDGIEFDLFGKFDKKYLNILTSIGTLIFLITLFNFFNLFYTQVLSRIREITTRKVLGSSKTAVFKILYGEIGFSIISSIFLSLTLLYLLNGLIAGLFDFSPIRFYNATTVVGTLTGAFLIAAVLILLITSQLLSYNTQLGLRGKMTTGKLGFNLSKLLLTCQLIVTLFSITYGLVISEQTNLLKNADVGYTYENIVTLKRPDNVAVNDWENLQQKLVQQASIESTGLAVFPSIGEYNFMGLKNTETQEKHRLYWIGIDHNYLPTMEIKMISGRNFDSKLKSDERTIIINEKALALLGGEKILDNEFNFRRKSFKIIGVVRDFNYRSLKEGVQPMMMTLNNPNAFRHMTVRYNGLTESQVSELINSTCRELNISDDLSLTFMEKDYNQKLLAEENVLSTVSSIFSVIAIIISLMGLFSYFNLMINQRKKDFSIRKVLGAKLLDNLQSMIKPEIVTLIMAIIISIPTALYFLIEWKSQFIYQLDLNVLHLLVPIAAILIIITLVTLGFSILIDKENPITNLKDD
jgi:putative ABC transport system permease protein